MSKWLKRIIILLLIPIIGWLILRSAMCIYKYPRIKIWDVGSKSYSDIYSFIYEGSQYYELEDLEREFGTNVVLDSSLACCPYRPYYLVYEKKDETQYAQYAVNGRNLWNASGADKFFEYENDSEKNVIFIEPSVPTPGGPSYGWYYIKEGFQFPTVDKNKVSAILISDVYDASGGSDQIEIEGYYYTRLDEKLYPQLISCIIEHKNYYELLPEKYKENTLMVQYEDCPLFAEEIAWYSNDTGEITWAEGGTP